MILRSIINVCDTGRTGILSVIRIRLGSGTWGIIRRTTGVSRILLGIIIVVSRCVQRLLGRLIGIHGENVAQMKTGVQEEKASLLLFAEEKQQRNDAFILAQVAMGICLSAQNARHFLCSSGNRCQLSMQNLQSKRRLFYSNEHQIQLERWLSS